jgi:uncharacterized protein
MIGSHKLFDHILFALLIVTPLVEWRWTWPRYLRRLAAGEPGVRLRFLRNLVVGEWVPTGCLLAFWVASLRPWHDLFLAGASTLRLALGLLGAASLAALLVLQRRAILKRPESIGKVREALAYAEPLLPRTQAERKLFWLVSFTAGICEEIFFRGFMTWYLSVWTGLVPAVLIASALFGLGHIYLGFMHVPRTIFVGLILAGVALASGSLWPAMLLHAALDWNSGELGYRILRSPRSATSTLQDHGHPR